MKSFEPSRLSVTDHDRASAGLTYIYSVLSRRSGGLSIGINLNTNNACNWRCVYCQVPNLKRGAPQPVNLSVLGTELECLLAQVSTAGPALKIRDIAISGNGEPTSSRELKAVMQFIVQLCASRTALETISKVLITNGSLAHQSRVRDCLEFWGGSGGEVWFKLDSATRMGTQAINGVKLGPERVYRNLRIAADICTTWLQTCVFQHDGNPPSALERAAYLSLLAKLANDRVPLAGVLMYGIARASQQPEANRLSPVRPQWIEDLATDVRKLGLCVKVHL